MEMEVVQRQKEERFEVQYGRFQQAVKTGQEVEASVLQTQILIEHGTWVD